MCVGDYGVVLSSSPASLHAGHREEEAVLSLPSWRLRRSAG